MGQNKLWGVGLYIVFLLWLLNLDWKCRMWRLFPEEALSTELFGEDRTFLRHKWSSIWIREWLSECIVECSPPSEVVAIERMIVFECVPVLQKCSSTTLIFYIKYSIFILLYSVLLLLLFNREISNKHVLPVTEYFYISLWLLYVYWALKVINLNIRQWKKRFNSL